jgi:gluconolactonase
MRASGCITFLIGLLSLMPGGYAQMKMGKIERTDAALDALLPQDATMEVLAEGFTWTEGPVWLGGAEDGHLLFSDIPRNSIFRWSRSGGVQLFMTPSGYTGVTYYGLEPGSNGLLLDSQGRLVMCEHGDRRVSVLTKDGGKMTLADRYQGKRLNSPNDAALKSNGEIYFTDPPYGLPQRYEDPRRELDHCGVYRVNGEGQVELLSTALERPNGIAFSPDEKTLYVAQSDPKKAIWMAFPVKGDGTLGEGKLLHDATKFVGDQHPGLPDGMAVDVRGNIWATGPGGVWIFSPEGRVLGKLLTGQRTSNCAFGEDGQTLFITADSYLLRIRTSVRGLLPKSH